MKNLAALLAALLLAITCAGCKSTGITGEEWLLMQEETTMADIEAFAEAMDSTYSLYIIGSITAEDFAVEHSLLQNQYDLMCSLYEQRRLESPIKPDGHTYESKRGSDAVEGILEAIKGILDNTLDEDGAPLSQEQVAYNYIAYQQIITNEMAEYIVATELINSAGDTTTTDAE